MSDPKTTPDSLSSLIAEVEAAGFDWAVGRSEGGHYEAAVEPAPAPYIGDDMSGPGCASGDSPYDALLSAFHAAKERANVG